MELSPKAGRHHILVVDDEAVIRLALATHLEDRGFEVQEACDADQAISILSEVGSQVDLVFTDVRMPGSMDGLGLSRWILENHPGVPVILASGDLGKMVAMKDLCGTQSIVKPYDLDDVTKRISATITRRLT